MKFRRSWLINNSINAHLRNYPTSLVLNYNWSFGSLTGFFLLIQLLSGLFLSFHYVAETNLAFESIDYLMREVNYGWLMRYSHANSASFFFIFMYLHIFRAIWYKSYTKPHEKVWISGVILLLLSIITAFIGYVLPWGQMSFWGATVITNLLTAIPLVGDTLVHWIWGGTTVGKATLTRFYSLHYILAIVLTFLVILHLLFLHRVGSSNPTGVSVSKENDSFNRSFGYKDLHALSWVLIFFTNMVFFHPDYLGHPDNYTKADPMVTPEHIVPEWYFLPFYAILRSVDDKFWGVVAMVSSIVILFFLPLCKRLVKDATFSGLSEVIKHMFFYLFFVSIVVLGIVGGLPAEYPYIQFGKVFTVIYFSSFFINFILSHFENFHARMLHSTSFYNRVISFLRRYKL